MDKLEEAGGEGGEIKYYLNYDLKNRVFQILFCFLFGVLAK